MPAAIPVAIPVTGLIVAVPVAPEVHMPPLLLLLKLVVEPAQTIWVPLIADGNGLTVTVFVSIQPVGNVYVMFAVPALIPVTFPDPLTDALPLLLLHVPPVVASVRFVVKPAHTADVPVILAGIGFILTVTLPSVPQQPDAD